MAGCDGSPEVIDIGRLTPARLRVTLAGDDLIDFDSCGFDDQADAGTRIMRSDPWNTRAAHHFLRKTRKAMRNWPRDAPKVEYLNNIIEADHGVLKQVIRPRRVSPVSAR